MDRLERAIAVRNFESLHEEGGCQPSVNDCFLCAVQPILDAALGRVPEETTSRQPESISPLDWADTASRVTCCAGPMCCEVKIAHALEVAYRRGANSVKLGKYGPVLQETVLQGLSDHDVYASPQETAIKCEHGWIGCIGDCPECKIMPAETNICPRCKLRTDRKPICAGCEDELRD